MAKCHIFLIGFALLLFGCQRRAAVPAKASVPPATAPAQAEGAVAAPINANAVAPPKKAPFDPTEPLRPGYTRPLIIDYHAHLSLDGVDRVAQIMTENGIEMMVNLSGGSFHRGPQAWIESKILADKLGGRVVNFMTPDWQGIGAVGQQPWGEREAARLQDAVERYGFRGLKIPKILGLGATDADEKLIAVDDPRLQPLWKKAADLGVPVSIHIADPKAFWLPLDRKNERWDELHAHPYWAYGPIPPELLQGPDGKPGNTEPHPPVPPWAELLRQAEKMYHDNKTTTFVAVHFGNAAEDLDYVDGLLTRNPNVWVDIAARVGEFGRHPPEKLRAFFIKWQDRMVFGTDIGISEEGLMLGSNGEIEPKMVDVMPFYFAHFRFLETAQKRIDHPSPIQGNWKIDAIDVPNDVLQKLYRDNARRLLDRDALRKFAAAVQP